MINSAKNSLVKDILTKLFEDSESEFSKEIFDTAEFNRFFTSISHIDNEADLNKCII